MANDENKKPANATIKLKFTSSSGMIQFHDKPTNWKDGDKRQVPEEYAESLLRDFPECFSKSR